MSSRRRLQEWPRLIVGGLILTVILLAIGFGIGTATSAGSSPRTVTTRLASAATVTTAAAVTTAATATTAASTSGAGADTTLGVQLKQADAQLAAMRTQLETDKRAVTSAKTFASCWRKAALHKDDVKAKACVKKK